MLKLLYKTLLVSVLSGSLLLLDFSYKGMILNSVRAESVKTDKINDKDLMGTLTMTVVGTLAKRLYTYKPTLDIALAASGGAIFLAGEVMAYFKLKDVIKGMEEQITRDKKGNVNKEQIEAIERLKKSYEEAKKTANTKKTLQLAAAAAFAAAAVSAYTLTTIDLTTLSACTTGIGGTLTSLKVLTAQCEAEASSPNPGTSAMGNLCLAEIAVCAPAVVGYKTALMKYEMHRQSILPSAGGLATAIGLESGLLALEASSQGSCPARTKASAAIFQGACKPLVPSNQKAESGGVGLTTPVGKNNILKDLPEIYKKELFKQADERQIASIIEQNIPKPDSMLMKVVDLFFPQAKAELFSAMGIASSLAISFILTTSLTIGPAIDMFMLIPKNRAIVWGILAGLTAAATMSTNNVISQIESNIKKIDEILKSMYSMADGATGTQIAPVATAQGKMTLASKVNTAPNAVKYEDVDLSNAVKGTLPCGTGEEGQKCKSFEESVKDLPSYQGLEAETKMQMDSIFKTASGVSGTSKISSGTMESAAKLASQSSAIKSSMDKARSTVAGKLKESGSSANLDADTKKLSDQIEKAINDGLKKTNTSASDMVANMSGVSGAGAGSSSANAVAASEAAKKAEAEAAALLAKNKAAAAAALAAADSVNLNAGTSDTIAPTMTNVDNGSNGEMSPEELAAYNIAAKKASGNMNDYDLKKEEISKDSGANLFELISNRYLQSGYPRLFRIKDPSAPATTEAVKN